MLRISEHFEYYEKDHLATFKKLEKWEHYRSVTQLEDELFFKGNRDKKCVSVTFSGQEENEEYSCTINTMYYIGLDYLHNFKLPVYVAPKLNTTKKQINYIKILLDVLKEPENFNHLDGLMETKIENNWIEIDSELQPILTPFLIAQFLSVVKDLVKRGLKKSYYKKYENLNNKVKGKVLIGQQIKTNILKHRINTTVCEFQEFGFDSEENKFLKFVLSQVAIHLSEFLGSSDVYKELLEYLNYCRGGFQQVNDTCFVNFRYRENNPFYKNYNLAIKLGNQILVLRDCNLSKTSNKDKVTHPPFWIDMSKLFELYVFRKLRERFPGEHQVKYHHKFNRQEPDFILNTVCGIKAVVDAKYKPRYAGGNPSMTDARQLAGYARLNSIYNELGIKEDIIIPSYFIYPSMLTETAVKKSFEIFIEKQNPTKLFDTACRESSTYRKMYLQEIDLVTI